MASKPHRSPPRDDEGPSAKRARPEPPPTSRSSGGSLAVQLNPADCNLDFNIEQNGLQGHALHSQGFAYCWSGARATVGITGGKYCFGCKVISKQAVDMADTPPEQQHVSRVGVSRGDDPVGNLGETMHSFGFGGTGKFSSAGKFVDYGARFGVGDVIVCAVNLDSKPLASIGFSKNGEWLGSAKQFDAGLKGLSIGTPIANRPWESALFPHVLLKNVVVELQFSIEDGLIPEEGYKPWSSALEDGNALVGPSFSSAKECEVLMMVGLPASGKTCWAEKWVTEHPEKRYVLLGTNLALEQMKVPGLLRKQNYGERFDRLMDRATGIFNTLLGRAAKTPRNYILDQTNVYRNARNRKLKPFVHFRKTAVVIFPSPDELKFRADKRFKEMGKEVPAEAVNEMLANYVLPMTKDMPGSTEFFDEVTFTELNREEAQRHLDKMKQELGSSNRNAKRDFSPYSRESSVQSFSSPSIEKKEAASGRRLTSPPPDLLQDLNPIQVNPAYSGSDSFAYPLSTSPYGYSNYGRASLQRDEPNPSGSYGGFRASHQRDEPDPYGNYGGPNSYRSPIPRGDTHQTDGVTDTVRRAGFEIPSPIGRLDYGYPPNLPSYSSPGSHVCDTRVHQLDRPATRDPSYEWRSPAQSPYGATHDLPSYSSLGAYQVAREPPYNFGSPYETPPPKPSSRGRPPINHPPLGSHARDPGVYQLDRPAAMDQSHEWRSPGQNPYGGTRDLPSYNSPGAYQAAREPPYNFGSPHGTPSPRAPYGGRPPINHPPGAWYR